MKRTSLLFLFLLLVVFFACNNTTDSISQDGDINVVIKSSEIYEYKTGISGDEESVSIIRQAKHYEISDVVRNADTKYEAVYRYKPKEGFIGTDYVELEERTGSDGASPPTQLELIKISIKVTL